MPDVFISYNREDREVAREVASGLEAEGFSVWYDAALRAGEYYEEVTETNLRSAGAVVVLWSKRSSSSKWVRAEATVGERSSTLVPALIEECERPVRFELLQTADLTRWHGDRNDRNWRDFVGDIRAAIGRRNGGQAQTRPSAPAQAPAVAAASRSDTVNIETTFWNSIKDGSERADFDAYLSRYPKGHFADLARNRIAAMDRASAKPAPSPLRQAPPAAAAAPRPAPAAQKPPPPRQAPPPQATRAKGGAGGAVLIAGAVAAIAATAVAAYVMTRVKDPVAEAAETLASATGTASASTPAAEPAETAATPGEPPSEPATDAFAGASDALAEDDPAATPTAEEPIAEPVEEEAPALEAPAQPAPAAAPPKPAPAVSTAPVKGAARDCEACPLMASLPGGTFLMGSPESEPGRNPYEGPQHEVAIEPFRIGVYEVTVGEWGQCAADGACAPKPGGEANLPVLRVSWNEAQAYVRWLSKKAGKTYRLPTESEWEYAARAGTATPWHWGDRFDAGRLARGEAKPVGSFGANAFGLHDMLSNAREWVEDCYANNFTQTPRDGSATKNGDCSKRVVRGGGFANGPSDTRVANRIRNSPSDQIRYMGFRVASD